MLYKLYILFFDKNMLWRSQVTSNFWGRGSESLWQSHTEAKFLYENLMTREEVLKNPIFVDVIYVRLLSRFEDIILTQRHEYLVTI